MRKIHRNFALALLLLALAGIARGQRPACPSPIPYGQNPAAGHVALVNGIRMYYETYGSGPPLLLIHGNGGSIDSMRCQIPYFSRAYRVMVADNRSHGKTEDGTSPLTYEQMADDLAALLVETRTDSVDIIGQSDGGIIALLLAIRHPSKVKKLVASGPNLRPDSTALCAWVFPFLQRAVDDSNKMIAKGDTSRDWAREKRWNELMLNDPHIPLTDLHKIQVPALIMGGDEDLITLEHLIEIYRNIPKAHLLIMPGATHFMLREEYELYNSIADRFLTQPYARPTTRKEIEESYPSQ